MRAGRLDANSTFAASPKTTEVVQTLVPTRLTLSSLVFHDRGLSPNCFSDKIILRPLLQLPHALADSADWMYLKDDSASAVPLRHSGFPEHPESITDTGPCRLVRCHCTNFHQTISIQN